MALEERIHDIQSETSKSLLRQLKATVNVRAQYKTVAVQDLILGNHSFALESVMGNHSLLYTV